VWFWLDGRAYEGTGSILKLTVIRTLVILLAGIVLAGTSIPVIAHHGTAAYDMEHLLTLKGTVTEVDWDNPHTEIYFDVKSSEGQVIHWGCISHSPNKLLRSGWSKSDVQSGDQVTVVLHPAKNGSHIGLLKELVLPNGKHLGTDDFRY
jgi:Family of unknown function (DUF6152)